MPKRREERWSFSSKAFAHVCRWARRYYLSRLSLLRTSWMNGDSSRLNRETEHFDCEDGLWPRADDEAYFLEGFLEHRSCPEVGFQKIFPFVCGMSVSDVTMQFLADILGAPVDRPKVMETIALGAAYLAGYRIPRA